MNQRPKKKRICFLCNSEHSYVDPKRGFEKWYVIQPYGHFCKNCGDWVRHLRERRQMANQQAVMYLLENKPLVTKFRTKPAYDKRKCYACGSTDTWADKTGRRHWMLNPDKDGNIIGVLCSKCGARYIGNKTEIHRKYFRQLLSFKDKRIHLSTNPRTGRCSDCGVAVETGEIEKTHLHHEYYDESDPLAGTVELCMSCHFRRGHVLGEIPKQTPWPEELKKPKQHRWTGEYVNWREIVFERDGYKCVKCGCSDIIQLEAHHICSYLDHKELRYDSDNGQTLCKNCHKMEHKHKIQGEIKDVS